MMSDNATSWYSTSGSSDTGEDDTDHSSVDFQRATPPTTLQSLLQQPSFRLLLARMFSIENFQFSKFGNLLTSGAPDPGFHRPHYSDVDDDDNENLLNFTAL